MTNIRQHVSECEVAVRTQDSGVPGVLFQDENEFIPFADLGYNGELGYYRLSAHPDASNECTNENPETIHAGEFSDPWDAYIWADADGYLHLLGEIWQVADLYQALGDFLLRNQLHPEKISEDDPEWGNSFSIAEAVAEAVAYGFPEKFLADRIRQAARDGRIPGARQDVEGRWMFRKAKFRGWLVNEAAHRPGRKAG